MDCPKCGASNAPLKKCCYRCGSILSGYTINNVTGEYGYRNSDGSFTKEPKRNADAIEAMQQISKAFGKMWEVENGTITFPTPIGYLRHEPTGYSLAVYKPISRFKRLMLRWAFGLKFEKI